LKGRLKLERSRKPGRKEKKNKKRKRRAFSEERSRLEMKESFKPRRNMK